MKTLLTACASFLLLLISISPLRADQVSDLESVALGGNGTYTAPTFMSGNALYQGLANQFSDGFTVSDHADTTDYGDFFFSHLYNAIPGGGSGPSTKYGVASAFFSASITVPTQPLSIDFTNTAYAYYSMKNGDPFAKQFGGETGDDADWFKITITGYDGANAPVGSIPFYLADYRFANNAQDYVLNAWATADLSSLVGARKLTFSLSSTDNGEFGMNTPGFFAMDNLRFANSLIGDMNGDDLVNNFDIFPFEIALTDATGYTTAYPWVFDYATRGDTSVDAVFNNFDIAPFEALLTGGPGAPVSVPEPGGLVLAAIGLAIGAVGRLAIRRAVCRVRS